ncbi:hypothetical protein [Noviherbaspirillum pedocola]|uniref:Uncharacterized protein n=1 Tax=Noviherbaspirillum pedocola TaxID=2801341 RepID=A0A934W8B7_9BURK|nr:hypothetical protein [Noviherbaspirillum pedocola]MBK4735639.1 hypothetical protein [Noviherbaspirillum pedocola]
MCDRVFEHWTRDYNPSAVIYLNIGDEQSRQIESKITPRAVKTCEGKWCAFYEMNLRSLVSRAPKWVQDYIEPCFAKYQMKAVLLEYAAANNNDFINTWLPDALKRIETSNVGAKSLEKFVVSDATAILKSMSTDQRKNLYVALQGRISVQTPKTPESILCAKLQRAIILCEVQSRNEKLKQAYSKVLNADDKGSNSDEGLQEIEKITKEVFDWIGHNADDSEGCALVAKRIGKAIMPSKEQMNSMKAGMTTLPLKIELLENIKAYKKDSVTTSVFIELYKTVDKLNYFRTPELIEKYDRGLTSYENEVVKTTSVTNSDRTTPAQEVNAGKGSEPVTTEDWKHKKIAELQKWNENLFLAEGRTRLLLSKKELFSQWISKIDPLLEAFSTIDVGVLKDNENTYSFNVAQLRKLRDDLKMFCADSRNAPSAQAILTWVGNILHRCATLVLNERYTPGERIFVEIARALTEIFLDQFQKQAKTNRRG